MTFDAVMNMINSAAEQRDIIKLKGIANTFDYWNYDIHKNGTVRSEGGREYKVYVYDGAFTMPEADKLRLYAEYEIALTRWRNCCGI